MRIGIDCRTILNPDKGEGAGVGHYTYQLVRHLLKIDHKNEYILFFDRSVEKRRLEKFRQKNVVIKFFPFIQYTRLMPIRSARFLVNATISREKLNVFHSPTLSSRLSYCEQNDQQGNLKHNTVSVVTVHDLAVYKFPELYLKEQVLGLKKDIPNILRQAKKIIAVSMSTSKDLVKIFNVDDRKIKVIFHGIDKRFFEKTTQDSIKQVSRKYGIGKNYFLFLGTLDSRKNIVRVISAYERFRKIFQNDKKTEYQLVLAGAKGARFQEISRKISFSKYKKDIILPGYIQADDLDAIFNGASIFVTPSLYEGFGLPIIEAMAKDVPVITSNISSMPEIAEGYSVLVDPYNVAEISQAMYNLLTDSNLRKSLILKGKKHAKEFSWEKCAKETLNLFKQANKN